MAVFEYTALDANGRQRKGVVEGDSGRQVRQTLRDQGLSPMSVTATDAERGNGASKQPSNLGPVRRRSLAPLELALITRQLATLIAAGLPVEESLNTVARQSDQRRVSALMMNVRANVLEGQSLAAALGQYPRAFGQMYRSTVAAGEHSGYLHVVLTNLAEHTERRFEATRDLQMALFYPIILFIVSVIIIAGLMIYVVPNIVSMFDDMDQQLPLLTTLLIDASHFLNTRGWMLAVVVIGAVALARWLLRQPNVRLAWDRRKLAVPIVAKIVRGGNASRYTSTLAILTTSGVALLDAVRIATGVVTNMWLKQRLADAVERVSEGTSLGAALEGVGHFPPMFLHMVASGEASGELDAMLGKVAQTYDEQVEATITRLTSLLEPLLILLMVGIVLVIILATLMPLLSITNSLH